MRLRWTTATAHVLLLTSAFVAIDLSVAQAKPAPPVAEAAPAAGAESSRALPDFVYRGVSLWPERHAGDNPTYGSSTELYTEPNPGRAFREGMHARLRDEQAARTFSIERHLQGGDRNISPYISTTESLETAKEFALGTGGAPQTYGFELRKGPDGTVRKYAVGRGIVYMIKPTRSNMVYVEEAAQREGVADKASVRTKFSQKEWAAFWKIDPQNIYAAQVYEKVAEVDDQGRIGTWSKAEISRYDFTIDGEKLKSFQINGNFNAEHPGYTPAGMPCSPGGAAGRAKRSLSACETGTPGEERPTGQPGEEPTAKPGEKPVVEPSAKELEALEARQIEEAFARLAGKYALNVVDTDGRRLSVSDIHARIRGYTKLSPQAKATVRAKLKAAGSTAKGALLVAGGVLWAKGVYEAFAEETTSLDKAAAITAIVPFVGCGTQAGASAEKGAVDVEDTVACFGGDALTVSPLWPLGLTVHGVRYFEQSWKAAQIPSETVFREHRDKAWQESFDAFRANGGFDKLVKAALATEKQQLEAEKAVVLHDAAEEIAAVERRFGPIIAEAPDAQERAKREQNSRLLIRGVEKRAEERIAALPDKLRKHYDKAIRDALVERAREYNEEFIKQQVDIERWKEDPWQSGVTGPRMSREDREKYLKAVVQLLRDKLPPVPHENDINLGIHVIRQNAESARQG
ncbi:hypothetical protein ACFP1Z_11260 [Streptomyces gamaensis]|uniref:Uncharacterized protein n=1 Tax=Streptomyces gamaensis TaxID=1763542 RepID=A0ABW0YZ24_9ACTN